MKFGIGQAVTRSEDRRFLTGSGRYSDDLRLPGQRHASFLRSPFAHARIRGIDTRAAKAKDGVVAVITAVDCDGELGDLPCLVSQMMPLTRADGTPIFEPPHRPLAGDRVRHVGEAVAMVIADDAALARDAAELIAVDYEALPAVVSVRAAGAAGAPAVWDGCPDNTSFDIAAGDREAVAAAFARADHVVELSHDVNRVAANPMEPRAALADYDAAEDRLTLWTGNQSPHDLRRYLAEFALGIPHSRLRVVSPDLGGGFGVRSSIYPELVMILWAARRLRCPVKWTAERGECFVCEHQARDNAWDAALALDAEGGFLALRVASSARDRRLSRPVRPGAGVLQHRRPRRSLPHPGDRRQRARAVHPHPADLALSRCRAARGELRHRDPDRPRRGAPRHRPRRIAAPQHDRPRGPAVPHRAHLHL